MEPIAGMMWLVVGILVVYSVVVGVVYYNGSPETRQKIKEEFNRSNEHQRQVWQKWNDDRLAAKAHKRARNALLWNVVGKIIKRM
jgi:hypothetical protein